MWFVWASGTVGDIRGSWFGLGESSGAGREPGT
jgi:hypothetical protein